MAKIGDTQIETQENKQVLFVCLMLKKKNSDTAKHST